MNKLFVTFATFSQILKLVGLNSEISIVAIFLGLRFREMNKNQVLCCFLILALLTVSLLASTLSGNTFKLSSFAIAVVTLIAIAMTNLEDLYSLKNFIVKFAVASVCFSIVSSFVDTYIFSIFEARTNFVIILNRLTFLFDEPSQYAIFLALVYHLVDVMKQKRVATILCIGLILTWSLSGFLLYFSIFIFRRLSKLDKRALKAVFWVVAFTFVLITAWTNYIVHTDFWIVSKVESIRILLDGDKRISSAMVRSTSIFMYISYIENAYINSNIVAIIFGEGFGNLNAWVSSFYSLEFNINSITEVNNFISSIIIQNGILGLGLFYLAFFSCFQSSPNLRPRALHFSFILFLLALFTGNAFGSLALLYFYLAILVAVDCSNRPKCVLNDV